MCAYVCTYVCVYQAVTDMHCLIEFAQIKVVDVTKKSCKTLAGSGTAGKRDGSFEEALFSEPGGLCVSAGGDSVFVADTNNHSIRILNTAVKSVEEVGGVMLSSCDLEGFFVERLCYFL